MITPWKREELPADLQVRRKDWKPWEWVSITGVRFGYAGFYPTEQWYISVPVASYGSGVRGYSDVPLWVLSWDWEQRDGTPCGVEW